MRIALTESGLRKPSTDLFVAGRAHLQSVRGMACASVRELIPEAG